MEEFNIEKTNEDKEMEALLKKHGYDYLSRREYRSVNAYATLSEFKNGRISAYLLKFERSIKEVLEDYGCKKIYHLYTNLYADSLRFLKEERVIRISKAINSKDFEKAKMIWNEDPELFMNWIEKF